MRSESIRMGRSGVAAIALALVAAVSSASSQLPAPSPGQSPPPPPAADTPEAGPESETERAVAPRQRGRRPDPERRGEFGRRPISPEQIDALIEAASEVVPEWGERLRTLRRENPEGLDRAIAANGRRLVALSMLRQRNPELYRMKVEELRNQMELRRLGTELRAAVQAGRGEDAEAIRRSVRALAERQVDFGLRIRAEELAAMDAALRKMREELEQEAVRRQQSIAELVAAVEAGEELPEGDEAAVDRMPAGGSGRLPGRGGGPMRPAR
jgi:hypothetical protein